MRHRSALSPHVIVAAALVALAACSDASPISAPADGTALGRAATSPADTAVSGTPFVPATSINLSVTVGAAVAGADTLASTPLAGAKVTVYARSLVATTGGADTLEVSEQVVASATTDAGGMVTFTRLPAAEYRVEADRDGTGAATASVTLAPPYPAEVKLQLIVRPRR